MTMDPWHVRGKLITYIDPAYPDVEIVEFVPPREWSWWDQWHDVIFVSMVALFLGIATAVLLR